MTMYGCPKSRKFPDDWKHSRLKTAPVDLDEDAMEEALDVESNVGEEEDFDAVAERVLEEFPTRTANMVRPLRAQFEII